MIRGALLGFAAYGLLASGDGVIKGIGGARLSVFEIGFWFCLAALCATAFMRPKHERWREVFRMRHPWLVLARCATGFGAGLFGVFAFITIPFAEAYAIIFLAPFIVMALSAMLLKERIAWQGLVAMALGFIGVLIVIRPGLRAVELGHLSAFGAATCSALTIIILRRIGQSEKRTVLLALPQLASLVLSGAIAGATGFVVPTWQELAMFAAAGIIGALGQLALLAAARAAPANVVGQTQYSQLIWALLIGALFFAEYPDVVALVGVVVIVVAGVVTATTRRVD